MLAAGSSGSNILGCRCFLYRLKNNNTFSDATGNPFSIRAVMVSSGGGSIAGAVIASGTAGPDSTLVFTTLGLLIVFVGHRSRK
jgi:hypothetical protein